MRVPARVYCRRSSAVSPVCLSRLTCRLRRAASTSRPYCRRSCASRVAKNGDSRLRLWVMPRAANAALPALPSMPLRTAAAASVEKNGRARFGSASGADSAQPPSAVMAWVMCARSSSL